MIQIEHIEDPEDCPRRKAGDCDERVVCTQCGYDGHSYHACEVSWMLAESEVSEEPSGG